MSAPITAYLSTVRDACESLGSSLSDPAAQSKLDMIVHILNGLIAQTKSQSGLEAAAVAAYRPLLQDDATDLASARAAVRRLLPPSQGMADPKMLSTLQRIVDIERAYFEGATRALQAELQRPNAAQQSDQPSSGLPDAERLSEYLSVLFATPVRVQKIDTVSLGFSKATFMLDVTAEPPVPASLVIRMDRANSFLGTTVLDEYPILRALHAHGVAVPQPYGLESTGEVLGQPFIVVARVHGRGLGSHFKFPAPNRRLCSTMAATLAKIHAIPLAALAEALPKPQSAYEELITDINKAHADWARLNVDVPPVEIAFALLKQHASAAAEGPRTLVHGDFSLSNLLIGENDTVSAVLDWEFARLGLPAADLGWCYEVATRLATWEEFLQAYEAAGGVLPPRRQLEYFALWGAVRLAVMVFQSRIGFERGEQCGLKQAFVSVAPPMEMVQRVSRRLQPLLTAATS
jgi:aminoglycoside phosphotransferase (APT) family kinase protein